MLKTLFLVTLSTFFLPSVLHAENEYKNGCDGSDLHECSRLVVNYFNGTSFFPEDQPRALHLFETAKRGAHEGCEAGRMALCIIEINLVLRPLVDLPIKDSHISAALEHFEAVTRADCETGSSAACDLRAGFYADQGVRYFLLNQAQKDGQPIGELAAKWQQDQNVFEAKMWTAVQDEARVLRPECSAGNPRSCGRLGLLIKARGLVANVEYEEIDFLIAGCGGEGQVEFVCGALEFSIGSLGYRGANQEQEVLIKANTMQKLSDQCQSGRGAFCMVLAKLADDRTKRDAWYDLACQAGHSRGCSDLGAAQFRRHKFLKTDGDLSVATANLKRGCKLGDGYACHMLEHSDQN